MKPKIEIKSRRGIIMLLVLASLMIFTSSVLAGESSQRLFEIGFVILLGTVFYGGYNLFIAILNAKHISNNPLTENLSHALRPNFVDNSVHYKIEQLGTAISRYSKHKQRGIFEIDGDRFTVGDFIFRKRDVQWVGPDRFSSSVQLDVNIDGLWYQIIIDFGIGSDVLIKELRKRVPESLNQEHYINRSNIRSATAIEAHITTQNLQGIFEKHEAVELYITPLWLLVLHDGHVIQQHFLDNIWDIGCVKHPTDLDDNMFLLTFDSAGESVAYALKDKGFASELANATKEHIDSTIPQKKKKYK